MMRAQWTKRYGVSVAASGSSRTGRSRFYLSCGSSNSLCCFRRNKQHSLIVLRQKCTFDVDFPVDWRQLLETVCVRRESANKPTNNVTQFIYISQNYISFNQPTMIVDFLQLYSECIVLGIAMQFSPLYSECKRRVNKQSGTWFNQRIYVSCPTPAHLAVTTFPPLQTQYL